MPIVEAHILRGYQAEEKQRLVAALTNAVRFVVPAPDAAITVMLTEHAPEAYARGGAHRQPAPAAPDPARIVRDYLSAMEARDLDRARTYLGAGFEMVFPGEKRMSDLAALVAWSKDRYRFVKKSFDPLEAFQGEGCAVVYTRGTLYGEWPDGTTFEGIRFIDRFELREGLITRQDVWNDLAEVRPA